VDFAICLHCGASYPSTQETCGICGQQLVPAGPAPLKRLQIHQFPPPKPASPPTNPRPYPRVRPIPSGTFTLTTLFLITTLVAILASIIAQAPGVGIMLAIVSIPALLRTMSSAARRKEAGSRPDALEMVGVFILSALLMIVIPIATTAAFFFTCAAAVELEMKSGEAVFLLSITAALLTLVGLLVVLWKTWPRRR
jgi:hypothetical protein